MPSRVQIAYLFNESESILVERIKQIYELGFENLILSSFIISPAIRSVLQKYKLNISGLFVERKDRIEVNHDFQLNHDLDCKIFIERGEIYRSMVVDNGFYHLNIEGITDSSIKTFGDKNSKQIFYINPLPRAAEPLTQTQFVESQACKDLMSEILLNEYAKIIILPDFNDSPISFLKHSKDFLNRLFCFNIR